MAVAKQKERRHRKRKGGGKNRQECVDILNGSPLNITWIHNKTLEYLQMHIKSHNLISFQNILQLLTFYTNC